MAATIPHRLGTALALAGALLLAPIAPGHASPATPAAPKPLPGDTKVTFTTHGWGHGHGMSQYGAHGAALRGQTWSQITSFYYPGTRLDTIGGVMKVRLTEDTTSSLVVKDRDGLSVRNTATGNARSLDRLHPQADRWRVMPLDARRNQLQARIDGSWRPGAISTGQLEFTAGGRPMALVLPDGDTASYRGTLRAARPPAAPRKRHTVNIVSLENYLRGVVPQEMPASWAPHALGAQAVAARSYAAFQRQHQSNGYYDVVDTTADQVYGGRDAETAATNNAIDGTRARIRTYRGQPAYTQFSSSMGGFTVRGSKPYLVSQADPYEKHARPKNPYTTDRAEFTVRELNRIWPRLGGINAIRLTKEPDTGGRYVAKVVVDGVKADRTYSGWDFRNALELRSPWFSVKVG